MNWKTTVYLSIFALIFLDSFLFNIPVGPLRMTFLRLVIIALFFVMLIRVLFDLDHVQLKTIRKPLAFFWFWFIWGITSLAWTQHKTAALKELYYFLIFLLLLYVLIYLLQSKMQNSWVGLSFWVYGFVIMLICVVEFTFNVHLPTSRYVQIAQQLTEVTARRATAFFFNENDLSVFLVLVCSFYFTGLLNKSIFFKIMSAVGIIGVLLINYYNDARLSLVSNLIQLAAFVILTKKNIIKNAVRSALVLSPLLLTGAAYYVYKLMQKDTLFTISSGDHSTLIRMNLYLDELYVTFQTFMLGVGPGNFPYNVYPQFNTLGIVNPHNWWFEIMSQYGFVIFVGFIWFYFYMVRQLYLIYRADRKNNRLALGLLIGWIGFFLACLAPSSLFYFWPMWLFFGVSLAYISYQKISVKSV